METKVENINTTVQNLPPAEWKARTMKLEEAAIENRESHAEIKVTFEQNKQTLQEIKDKVDSMKSP
jgi:hypothetical protein